MTEITKPKPVYAILSKQGNSHQLIEWHPGGTTARGYWKPVAESDDFGALSRLLDEMGVDWE